MNVTVTKIYQRTVHSYIAIFDVFATGSEDPAIFVVKKDHPFSSSSSSSSHTHTCSSSSISSSSSLVSSSMSSPSIFLDQEKVLISVASLEDLAVYVDYFPGYGQLYRSDNVGLIFTSESVMDLTVDAVVEDIRINARIQAIDSPALETITYSDTDIVIS
jgi:hypothetical protein